jgi:SPP1 gp7 family putative phage head morphogenesis protein
MKKTLKPIEPKDSWHQPLARQIYAVFYAGIYAELIRAVKQPTTNAGDDSLIAAIRSGKIRFLNGKFSGDFTAATSKQLRLYGAVFDARSKTWAVPLSNMAPEVKVAIESATRAVGVLQSVMDAVVEKTSERVNLLLKGMDLSQFANKTADKIDEQFKETVSDAISVQPKLSPVDAIRFDENYVKSMTRPIKKVIGAQAQKNVDTSTNKFANEEVVKLRKEIGEWVKSGKSRKGLADMIDSRLKVGKDRAKFIARQETALYTSDFVKSQYEAAGIEEYEWDATLDSRTRPLHRELDGQVFSMNNPPVVDFRTQERGIPGQAFGCRCRMKPIVRFT